MATTKHSKKYSFYRPHEKVTFGNELVHPFTGEITYPPSLTKQEHAAECDINNIIQAFSQTGQINHVRANAALGRYADLPDHLTLQDALNITIEAEAAFMSLPAKVRDRFHQDPSEFLAFMADPENKAEAMELGLLELPRENQPVITQPIDPPPKTEDPK